MSQTNTNTNNCQNLNQISTRGGRGWGGPSGSGRGNCHNGHENNLIAKYSYEGKMKECCLHKLIITKTGHRPSQFKKIYGALPVLCADKNFWGLNEVLWTERDLVGTDFMPPYSDATQWSTTHHVQVSIANPANPEAADGSRPACFKMM